MQPFFASFNSTPAVASFGLLADAAGRRGIPRPLPSNDGEPGLELDISEELRQLLDLPLNPRPDTVFSQVPAELSDDRRGAHGLPAEQAPSQLPPAGRAGPAGTPVARREASGRLQIYNRAQAMKVLQDFESECSLRLPQLGPGRPVADRVILSMGMVQFNTLAELIATFPCAIDVAGAVVYPQGHGAFAAPRKALLGAEAEDEIVVARRPSNHRRIRYTTDLRHWHPANIYTDNVVEDEKLAMWTRIFTQAGNAVLEAARR
jgi:hypothetical protein